MIVFLSRQNTKNSGDLASSPELYFRDLGKSKRLDILGWSEKENTPGATADWRATLSKATIVIVGGGGLLAQPYFTESFFKLAKYTRPSAPIIAWGIGHNSYANRDWRMSEPSMLELSVFDKIGLRDQSSLAPFVPCCSCMSSLFDNTYTIEHDFVYYHHENDTFSNIRLISTDIPTLSNSCTFEEAIKFLGSGATVLTDSYHGMYWATLLGRKVVAFPWSSKFYKFKFPSVICRAEEWDIYARQAVKYDEAKELCRAITIAFRDTI